MTESWASQATRAMDIVVEGACPLCAVEFVLHDGRACCPRCGDSYVVSCDHLEIKPCPEHKRGCKQWIAVRSGIAPSSET